MGDLQVGNRLIDKRGTKYSSRGRMGFAGVVMLFGGDPAKLRNICRLVVHLIASLEQGFAEEWDVC